MKAARSTLLLFCFAGFLVGFVPPLKTIEKEVIATWVWNTGVIATEQANMLSFVKENRVNLLYLQIDPNLQLDAYRTFIKNAEAAGIEVHALAGQPSWAFAENQTRLEELIDWVITYNKSVASTEQFAGIHLDIEPYLLPQWTENRSAVIRQWMNNVSFYVTKAKKDGSLQISCDIPFWLDEVAVPGQPSSSLGEWMIKQHDHVTLMSYRDQAEGTDGIISLVQNELAAADRLGKKIIVGVDMKQSIEGEYVSFHEEGKAEMVRQLSLLQNWLNPYASFRGISVHSYEYWKVAKE